VVRRRVRVWARVGVTDDGGNAADPAPFPSMVVIYNGKNSLPQNNVSGTVPKETCA